MSIAGKPRTPQHQRTFEHNAELSARLRETEQAHNEWKACADARRGIIEHQRRVICEALHIADPNENLVDKDITDCLVPAVKNLEQALRVIAKALDEGKEGEFHTARAFLDEHDVFHGDLSGERVLLRVAQVALGTYKGK